MKVWECKVGWADGLSDGADGLMREAVEDAYVRLTGNEPGFVFSGWGGKLTESELAVLEDREPVPQEDLVEAQAQEIAGLKRERDDLEKRIEAEDVLHSQTVRRIEEDAARKDEALRDAIGMLQWATGAWRPEGTPETELAPARLRLHEAIERYRAALEGETK